MLLEDIVTPRLLTCAIIDDDEINRLTLQHCIGLTSSLHLIASLKGGVEGLNFFSLGRRVDVLFLDVEMPDLNGIEMIRLVPEPPEVIFTTAYESFGMEAYELNIADYLVKPFSYGRFQQAVQRAAERLHPALPVKLDLRQ
ncbi:response regulator receiver protein [Hymenobacter roseosalivarius DSM 11622]|uniref:Response regulator receiver protein n=1 Tax=Hymenobacter roseosalivarius DSM 11622 TaxID=645990 RepID=A0A1W1VJY5_9BACT|nr:response regulator [Hymenobacter roseosalivarius]SMB93593.1 response regulator receiver protein [Hymenobacter roseosalivarius DSM 11622]